MKYDQDWEKLLPRVHRRQGFGQPIDPFLAASMVASPTPEEIGARHRHQRRNAMLFAWVVRQMRYRLTRTERRCLELRFLENLSTGGTAAQLGIRPSTASRATRRGLRKLRALARAHGIGYEQLPDPKRRYHRKRRGK